MQQISPPKTMNYPYFKCPVCSGHLSRVINTYVCAKNHSFDLSKEGYVNLLLSNQKNSLNPGDSQEMIQARRGFLEKGFYDFIAKKLTDTIKKNVDLKKPLSIIDIGCGEGYYLNKIMLKIPGQACGVDISKSAIQKAAKKYPEITWAIATSFHLPITEKTQNLIINTFSPLCFEEFIRIAEDKGKLICVMPASEHLLEVKKIMYDKIKPTEDFSEKLKDFPELHLVETVHTSKKLTLEKEDLKNLFMMTPIYWNASPTARKTLDELDSFEVTLAVNIVTIEIQKD